MDLADILQQDVMTKANSSVKTVQDAEKAELANVYQSLQNDRYGQVTPYEVMQQRLAGLRADTMADPAALKSYREGTLGQFNTQARADRRGAEVEAAGINPDMVKAQKEQRENRSGDLAQGIDEVTQMFAAGHSPESVYQHIAKLHGAEVADYFAPVIKQGIKGVTGFHNYLLQNDPKYRQHIDQAQIGANATITAAEKRGGSGSYADEKFAMKRDAGVVKNAKDLWTAKTLEMNTYTMGSKEYKKAQAEATQLAQNYANINKAYESKYNHLLTATPEETPTGLPAGVTVKKP